MRPKPGVLLTANPAAARPSRTCRATVKVLAVVPGPLSLAIPANSSGRQSSGFFAGAKPSRNQASATGLALCRNAGWSLAARSSRPATASANIRVRHTRSR
ncbi:MAG: hypothetical protein WC247_09050 [Porticoccaceae bacterium]